MRRGEGRGDGGLEVDLYIYIALRDIEWKILIVSSIVIL